MSANVYSYNRDYPAIKDLIKKAQRKIPKFAFEYLHGGCNENVNLARNTNDLRSVQLIPKYLEEFGGVSMKTELFGHTYAAPFGIAPIGLQGLIWPNAPQILAKAATEHNIPFVLSTVSTASIETIGKITSGRFWFQLYNPAKETIRLDVLKRAQESGCKVLVLLCDVPTFGFRPNDIRNGLSMPPRMTFSNVLNMLQRPSWATKTLIHGQPRFETLRPYMPSNLNLKQMGVFMDETFSGRLDQGLISKIREVWKGQLVLKGVSSFNDTEKCIKMGLDGIIVSNHGGRQLDAGESTIVATQTIAKKFGNQIKVMMDSGIRTGPDIARAMAHGAEFTFLGRTFMYSVAALGNDGGNHAIGMLKTQLQQIMEQISCATPNKFPSFLANSNP